MNKKQISQPMLAGLAVNFILRSSFTMKNGEHPIVLKIRYLDERKEINTGLSVAAEYWLPRIGLVDHQLKTALSINQELYNIRQQVESLFIKMKQDLGDFRLSELVERLKGRQEPPQSILEYVELKMQDLKAGIGVDIAKTTFYKYNRTANYLKEYIFLQTGLKNLPVSRIDKTFLEGFFKYLRVTKKNSFNSSSSLMNCLKTILQEPVKKGVIRYNPFKEMQLTRKPVIRDFLNDEEIRKLQAVNNLTDAQSRNRDIFLFACFTGLSYSDFIDFKGKHIIVDPDGSKHIHLHRNKTKVLSYIPLMKAAEDILLKYSPTGECRDFSWKIPSNQKLNASLKVIAQKAGIDKPLFMHLARHTFATTVTMSNGLSIESVSSMLGHSSLKHTQIYAKIVNKKVKNDMEKIKDCFS